MLLPAERELCEALGITKEEYFFFVEEAAKFDGIRAEKDTPLITADIVTAFIAKNAVAIGIALLSAGASYLLAPKPKNTKKTTTLRTSDSIGNERYARESNFDSVQELASYGDAIPLAFTEYVEENGKHLSGGLRLQTQLLWSRFASRGRYQQLATKLLLGQGKLAEIPNIAGFAIGDNLIENYNLHKLAAFFVQDGGDFNQENQIEASRLKNNENYDPFVGFVPTKETGEEDAIVPKIISSAARNPSTNSTFGVYSCMPNAQTVRLPYELVRPPAGSPSEGIYDIRRLQKKVESAHWPTFSGFVVHYRRNNNGVEVTGLNTSGNELTAGNKYDINSNKALDYDDLKVDDILVYQLIGTVTLTNENGDVSPEDTFRADLAGQPTSPTSMGYDQDPINEPLKERGESKEGQTAFGYYPHGVKDVDNMTISHGVKTDESIEIGEQYLIGGVLCMCIAMGEEDEDGGSHGFNAATSVKPWTIGSVKNFYFQIIELPDQDLINASKNHAVVDLPATGGSLTTHCQNPVWLDPLGDPLVDDIDTEDDWEDLNDADQLFYSNDKTDRINRVVWRKQKISGNQYDHNNPTDPAHAFVKGTNDLYYGYDVLAGQRVAIATIVNSSVCDVTEIGLKSNVYKRLRIANVASQPEEGQMDALLDEGTQIVLGQLDRYLPRYSFFKIQVKPVNEDRPFETITYGGDPNKSIFAVEGRIPEAQYNTIQIRHLNKEHSLDLVQYEYRFLPVSGNHFIRINDLDKNENYAGIVHLLKSTGHDDEAASGQGLEQQFSFWLEGNEHAFNITFRGYINHALKETDLTNAEYAVSGSSYEVGRVVESVRTADNGTAVDADKNYIRDVGDVNSAQGIEEVPLEASSGYNVTADAEQIYDPDIDKTKLILEHTTENNASLAAVTMIKTLSHGLNNYYSAGGLTRIPTGQGYTVTDNGSFDSTASNRTYIYHTDYRNDYQAFKSGVLNRAYYLDSDSTQQSEFLKGTRPTSSGLGDGATIGNHYIPLGNANNYWKKLIPIYDSNDFNGLRSQGRFKAIRPVANQVDSSKWFKDDSNKFCYRGTSNGAASLSEVQWANYLASGDSIQVPTAATNPLTSAATDQAVTTTRSIVFFDHENTATINERGRVDRVEVQNASSSQAYAVHTSTELPAVISVSGNLVGQAKSPWDMLGWAGRPHPISLDIWAPEYTASPSSDKPYADKALFEPDYNGLKHYGGLTSSSAHSAIRAAYASYGEFLAGHNPYKPESGNRVIAYFTALNVWTVYWSRENNTSPDFVGSTQVGYTGYNGLNVNATLNVNQHWVRVNKSFTNGNGNQETLSIIKSAISKTDLKAITDQVVVWDRSELKTERNNNPVWVKYTVGDVLTPDELYEAWGGQDNFNNFKDNVQGQVLHFRVKRHVTRRYSKGVSDFPNLPDSHPTGGIEDRTGTHTLTPPNSTTELKLQVTKYNHAGTYNIAGGYKQYLTANQIQDLEFDQNIYGGYFYNGYELDNDLYIGRTGTNSTGGKEGCYKYRGHNIVDGTDVILPAGNDTTGDGLFSGEVTVKLRTAIAHDDNNKGRKNHYKLFWDGINGASGISPHTGHDSTYSYDQRDQVRFGYGDFNTCTSVPADSWCNPTNIAQSMYGYQWRIVPSSTPSHFDGNTDVDKVFPIRFYKATAVEVVPDPIFTGRVPLLTTTGTNPNGDGGIDCHCDIKVYSKQEGGSTRYAYLIIFNVLPTELASPDEKGFLLQQGTSSNNISLYLHRYFPAYNIGYRKGSYAFSYNQIENIDHLSGFPSKIEIKCEREPLGSANTFIYQIYTDGDSSPKQSIGSSDSRAGTLTNGGEVAFSNVLSEGDLSSQVSFREGAAGSIETVNGYSTVPSDLRYKLFFRVITSRQENLTSIADVPLKKENGEVLTAIHQPRIDVQYARTDDDNYYLTWTEPVDDNSSNQKVAVDGNINGGNYTNYDTTSDAGFHIEDATAYIHLSDIDGSFDPSEKVLVQLDRSTLLTGNARHNWELYVDGTLINNSLRNQVPAYNPAQNLGHGWGSFEAPQAQWSDSQHIYSAVQNSDGGHPQGVPALFFVKRETTNSDSEAEEFTANVPVIDPQTGVAFQNTNGEQVTFEVTAYKQASAANDATSYFIEWERTQSPQGGLNLSYLGLSFLEGDTVQLDFSAVTNNLVNLIDLTVGVEDPTLQHQKVWTMYWQNMNETEVSIEETDIDPATGIRTMEQNEVRFRPDTTELQQSILINSGVQANFGTAIFSIGDKVIGKDNEYKIKKHGVISTDSQAFVTNQTLLTYRDAALTDEIENFKIIVTSGYVSKKSGKEDYYFFRLSVDPNNNGAEIVNANEIFYIPRITALNAISPYDADISSTSSYQLKAITSATSQVKLDGIWLDRFDKCSDWSVFEGDEASNDDNPEHEISFVNELTLHKDETLAPAYPNMAMAGLIVNSSKEWTSFSQASVYLKKGLEVEKLDGASAYPAGTLGCTNNIAEIIWALLTNEEWGSGARLGFFNAKKDDFKIAAKWCRLNKFTFDGVISSAVPLRQFIHEYASYMLLDFLVIGGQISLLPAVPYETDETSDNYLKFDPDSTTGSVVPIAGLFTDGNMSEYKVTSPSLQERQSTKIAVKYRQENANGFPEDKILTVRLKDDFGGSVDDPVESYDWTGFATVRKHCEDFAKFKLQMRKNSDHAISFLTSPQYIYGIEPSDYIRIVSKVAHISRFENGIITDDGKVITTSGTAPTGSATCYIYQTSSPEKGLQEVNIDFTNITADHYGSIYTVKKTESTSAVYKVEAISYAEDGLVEVTASYFPVDLNSKPLIYNNWANAFDIESL